MTKESANTTPLPLPINATTLLVILLIIAAFLLGSLTTKVQYLEKSGTAQNTQAAAAQPTTPPQQQAPQQPTVNIDKIKALFNDKNITFGDKNSKNLLVEVADPSCPFCHVAAGLNPTLSAQMGDRFKLEKDGGTYVAPVIKMKEMVDSGKAALVWIYARGHGNGEMGTKAMYCAHEKGKFWPVHDKLMTNEGYTLLNDQVKNEKSKSQELANFLSDVYDASAMKSCLESGKYDNKITEDVATAASLGANGTPGFFINTQNFAGAYSWKDMESAVK
ncbi:MAG: DsbA family protein [Candidatus Levybacteria bacterium]|nr:DsbA family protein [Candidatus Levybacteria bacterium]